MKIRYDVRAFDQEAFVTGKLDSGIRFIDQREAFNLAKKIAIQCGEAIMTKLAWNDKGKITTKSCIIQANGEFKYL